MTPCLLGAIEVHKYYKSCERQVEVDFIEAAEDFHRNYEEAWRAEKLREDNRRQIEEMNRHKWYRSQMEGHDCGKGNAAAEWISKYAAEWRRWRESLTANGFVTRDVAIQERSMLTCGGLSGLVGDVARLSCDVFVSQDRMQQPEFTLEPEPGAPIMPCLVFRPRHLERLEGLELTSGAFLRFIAFGGDVSPALDCIECAARSPIRAG